MFILYITALVLNILFVSAGTTCSVGNKDRFNECATAAVSQTCSNFVGNNLNSCLCSQYQNLGRCYNSFCPGDPNYRDQVNGQLSYCDVRATRTETVVSLVTQTVSSGAIQSTESLLSMMTIDYFSTFTMETMPLTSASPTQSLTGLPPFPNLKGEETRFSGMFGLLMLLINVMLLN